MKLIMTGLDHKRAGLAIREKFVIAKESAPQILATIKSGGIVGGCVAVSTCNRTELYASVPDGVEFAPTQALCCAVGREFAAFEQYFTKLNDDEVIRHLCSVASGLESQVLGDAQVITQVREALEISRAQGCADSYIETAFNAAISAAKAIRTRVILKAAGADSIPGMAVEKLKAICQLAGRSAVVIGNGQVGKLVSELLIHENVHITVALRQNKKGAVRIPEGAGAIDYSERYKAVEQSDIVVSATASPHYTLYRDELDKLARLPEIIVDLAVPRDVEPSVHDLSGITFLTIKDLSGNSGEDRVLPPESVSVIEGIIAKHIMKYNRWLAFKKKAAYEPPKIKACYRIESGVY